MSVVGFDHVTWFAGVGTITPNKVHIGRSLMMYNVES